jgi:glutaminyl-peptide cyclotransferase
VIQPILARIRIPGAWPALASLVLVSLASCEKKKSAETTPEATPEVASQTPGASATPPATPEKRPLATPARPRFAVSTKPAPAEIWKEFSGSRAMLEVKRQAEIGPRPSGSAELETARKHITSVLEPLGWEVERQEFTDQTPRGPLKFVNIIARFSADGARPVPTNTQRAILCSHYDTKRFSTIKFVGANDGASSTGALLELARVLALDPALASKIELVFFDGEEALLQFTETDGFYGSKHYAKALRDSKRNTQFVFGILWDMIGDADLTITLPPDSPSEVANGILASASALGTRPHFTYFDRQIGDDHVPLNVIARIPTVDLIDFNYLWWHTADDTLDRLSPTSLEKIGMTTLHYVAGKVK